MSSSGPCLFTFAWRNKLLNILAPFLVILDLRTTEAPLNSTAHAASKLNISLMMLNFDLGLNIKVKPYSAILETVGPLTWYNGKRSFINQAP